MGYAASLIIVDEEFFSVTATLENSNIVGIDYVS